MGAGNNLGIKNVRNDYAFILNPDVILQNNTIDEIIEAVKSIDSFGLVAPISDKIEYPNYKFDTNKKQIFDLINPFKVKSVDGYAMLLNLKQLRKIKTLIFLMKIFFCILKMRIYV